MRKIVIAAAALVVLGVTAAFASTPSQASHTAVAGCAKDTLNLVSEGNLTLIRTVEAFDYTRGLKFSKFIRAQPNPLRHCELKRRAAIS